MNAQQVETNISRDAAPWVRYAARTIDLGFFGGVVGALQGYLFPQVAVDGLVQPVVILLVYTVVEAVLLSTWETTPGKWLLNCRLADREGARLTFSRAWRRAFTVFWRGSGAGLPLFALIGQWAGYNSLVTAGTTAWDRQFGTVVIYGHVGAVRGTITILLLVGLFAAALWV